ncbi:MAG: hypothetical protein HC835_16605 [Oscillatoriales cyanobacterium RM2_1_1]|nr:hypothetical protein [Oscillatoriales cyanobacterium SM2_3_0]NJO47106.1 hypothetical protein [Oscillatoriales cyanobacterium RM2_1_1]
MLYLEAPLLIPLLAAVYLLIVRLLLIVAERTAKLSQLSSGSNAAFPDFLSDLRVEGNEGI